MRLSMAKPPNYLKGQDRLAYMEERAWVSNDFADYCGREGKYADKAEPFEEKMTRLTAELSEMFAKSHELEQEIRKKLGAIGYDV